MDVPVMTDSLFVNLLFGHLVSDYLLQPKSMAERKSYSGVEGHLWCTYHCLIYTTVVCLFLWTINPIVIGIVFLSHWPIDRWGLGSKWLCLINGRDFKKVYRERSAYWEVHLTFATTVYIIVDNTMHLLLMYYLLRMLT